MAKPVNNQWIDELLKEALGAAFRVAVVDAVSDPETELVRIKNKARQAILSKLESIEQEAYKKGYVEGWQC